MSSTQTQIPTRRVKYVRLGNSGLKVSKIILGCMSYGSKEWSPWVLEEEEAIKHIKFAYDAGIQTFDTANVYSNGLSEIILGNAIKKTPTPAGRNRGSHQGMSFVTLAVYSRLTVEMQVLGAVGKTVDTDSMELYLAGPDNLGYVNQHGLSRKHIFASVKASLARLQLDYIDVLQCHRFDENTPVAETMQALHDVVQAGFVRYIGMSSCYAWQFHLMQNYAISHNLTPFISMQNQYSLVYREEEREMMPVLKHFGVGSIPWSPLARGALTRPYAGPQAVKSVRQETDVFPPDAYFSQGAGNKDVVARVEEIAKKHNKTMAQVSLAWLMAKDGVTAPIIGTTSLERLEDLIGALEVKLSPEDMKYLEEPYTPMNTMYF